MRLAGDRIIMVEIIVVIIVVSLFGIIYVDIVMLVVIIDNIFSIYNHHNYITVYPSIFITFYLSIYQCSDVADSRDVLDKAPSTKSSPRKTMLSPVARRLMMMSPLTPLRQHHQHDR